MSEFDDICNDIAAQVYRDCNNEITILEQKIEELKWALSKCNPCTTYTKCDDGYIEHCYFCASIGNDSHRNDCQYTRLIK